MHVQGGALHVIRVCLRRCKLLILKKRFSERGEGSRFFTSQLRHQNATSTLVVSFFILHFLPYYFLSSSLFVSSRALELNACTFFTSSVQFQIISTVFILHVNFTNVALTLRSHKLWNLSLSFLLSCKSFYGTISHSNSVFAQVLQCNLLRRVKAFFFQI